MTPREKTLVRNALAAIHRDIGAVLKSIDPNDNITIRILCDDLENLEHHALEVLGNADRTITTKKARR